jgi:hypothetical protein
VSTEDDEAGFAAAQAAQAEFVKAGGNIADPGGPLYQWITLREIEDLRAQFEAGSSISLFAAIRKCANHDIVMQEWVALGYIRGYDRVLRCESDSWDEAFGLPYGKQIKKNQLAGMKRRRNIRFAAYYAVEAMHESGHPIDVTTFAVVAKQLGSNGTEIGKLYYAVKRGLTRKSPTST